jgi:hypothetical protein
MDTRGFRVSIPAGARNSALSQSIRKSTTGNRSKELFRGIKKPDREIRLTCC